MAPVPAAPPPSSDPWAIGDAWLRRADAIIAASAGSLNAINVFPLADADTGTNLTLTLAGMTRAVPPFGPDTLDAWVQAAIMSAHGNSGAIVAEMVASVCRWLQNDADRGGDLGQGTVVSSLLGTAATAATKAVATPVIGTILTVADEAARAAAGATAVDPSLALPVAVAAQQAAATALRRTTNQLDVLEQAGVVDAGGQGFVLLLDCVVEVLGGPPARPLSTDFGDRVDAEVSRGSEYEVMYALRGAASTSLDELRRELSVLGHSVVLVGDQSLAQVHVHLAEPGRAIEAALGRGALSQITVTALPSASNSLAAGPPGPRDPVATSRTVASVVAGPGIARAVEAHGGVAVPTASPEVLLASLEGLAQQTFGELILLPNDMESLEIATHVAAAARSAERRVAVIPTVVQVQGLASIAVHEPTADFDAAVVAMSAAAGHARSGAVTLAETATVTMVGRAEPGAVLGVVEGDFVEVGNSVAEVAWRVIGRLLASGGELLTLVTGAGCDAATVDELTCRAHARTPAVEVERIEGGQPRYLLLIGVE